MNNNSRIDNSIRNIKYTVIAQMINFLIVFASRAIFVRILSAEYLGLNGVFSNIISMLSLAELGIGSAICFTLYKPIANNDEKTVNSIMKFYKTTYNIIGVAVLVIGVALTPFLQFIVEELPNISHIRLIYVLFVVNSASSYFFVYKKTLLIADQRQYISNIVHQASVFLMNVLQIFFLLATHNYFSYLIIMIACTVGENIFVSRLVNKKYPYINSKTAESLPKEKKNEIFKNITAMASHRIGGVVVNGTDNIIIAKCVNVISVGLYSNYYLIKNTLISVISMLFQSVTASVGNLGAQGENYKRRIEVFDALNMMSAILIGFSSVCLFVLYNPFVKLWVGENMLLDMKTVSVIVVNFYLLGMRQPVLTVRDALGIFWYDRHKPIAESIINLAVSIPLAIKFGMMGVLLGTLISTVTTSLWVEPYVLYRYGLKKSPITYFIKYIVYFAVCVITAGICYTVCNMIELDNGYIEFILKALTCSVLAGIILLLCYCKTKPFQTVIVIVKNKLLKKRV